jgi:stage V sporulation protein R
MRIKSSLPTALKYQAVVIEAAARDAGLDFHDVVFELLDAAEVNGVAAYGGFPIRYASWRFGMEYERLAKGHRFGLSKIYELVINNDPVYAYLVSSNSALEQKLVMAHVYGHADFFKHNIWFARTDRRMLETMGRHAALVRRLMDTFGQDKVERTLDDLLSLEGLIDPYRDQRGRGSGPVGPQRPLSERRRLALEQFGFDTTQTDAARPRWHLPDADVLGFLLGHAPLDALERELLPIVRDEAYYFAPQRMTKVANEGWACLWHSRLLTGGLLEASEVIDFADIHSGATAAAPGQWNPYKLGLRLWREAEHRGLDLFLLRRVHGDLSLIDLLVDEEFVLRYHGLTPAQAREATSAGLDWVAWKQRLLSELAFGGLPRIELVAWDQAQHALELEHRHDGRDLELGTARETLTRLAKLWKGKVTLATQVGGQRQVLEAGARGGP